MPRYDYTCNACGQTFEATHGMNAGPLRECRLCGSEAVQKRISLPMLNWVKSGSPTGAKYEQMTTKEIIDMEAEPLAAMEQQDGMAEKMAIMYGGKMD